MTRRTTTEAVRPTPWFPGTVKPARVGPYQRSIKPRATAPFFSMWDGKQWLVAEWNAWKAAQGHIPSTLQEVPWRGIDKPTRSKP